MAEKMPTLRVRNEGVIAGHKDELEQPPVSALLCCKHLCYQLVHLHEGSAFPGQNPVLVSKTAVQAVAHAKPDKEWPLS